MLCTGSQGEPLSALTRIAYHDHPSVRGRARRHGHHLGEARPGQRAARPRHDQPAGAGRRGSPPPGDRPRPRLRARQLRGDPHGARARAPQGGHARARRVPHARGAGPHGAGRGRSRQTPIVLAENGSVVELSADRRSHRRSRRLRRHVRRGLAVGDITDVALRDRRRLSEDGVMIVVATLSSANGRDDGNTELIARGFPEADELLEELRAEAGKVLDGCCPRTSSRSSSSRSTSTTDLGQLVYDRTRRRPLILPVVVEVRVAPLRRATGPACSRRTRPSRRPGGGSWRSFGPARCPRSRFAGCSSGGRAGTLSHVRPGSERRPSSVQPTGPRRRSGPREAGCPLPPRARARHRRGPLVVRRAGAGGAARVGRTSRPVRACTRRRFASRRCISSWPCSCVRSRGCRSGEVGCPPDRNSLWAGLFDLRENLLDRAVEDLRALAA